MKIGISACLLGEQCTWKGTNNKCEKLIQLLSEHTLLSEHPLVKICPEVMGGLSIPRHPCEIINLDPLLVETKDHQDYTSYYLSGSLHSLEKTKDCDFYILKANSPSCGNEYIYDGTFTHTLIKGKGVFASMIKDKPIYNEKQLEEIKEYLRRKGKWDIY